MEKVNVSKNLGERIYKLRIENRMSQEDLAEKMNVSRQSVSKWENNSAIPDLDKIIKMSALFDISMDELVKGDVSLNEKQNVDEESIHMTVSLINKKIIGTLFFCMGFFVVVSFFLAGLKAYGCLVAIPFWVCGVLWLCCKKNIGLWCIWVVYFCVDIYMVHATYIRRVHVFNTIKWIQLGNLNLLIVAWLSLIITCILMIVTIVRFSEKKCLEKITILRRIIVLGTICGVTYIIPLFCYKSERIFISIMLEWPQIIMLTIIFVNIVRMKNCLNKT